MALRLDSSKEINRRLILEQIRTSDAISRSEIVDATGLSKAAVSTLVGELIDAGLVEETGSQSTAIGRPRIQLSLIAQAGLAIGAELTNQECRVILTDLRATPLRHVEHPVPGNDLSPDALLDFLKRCVDEITEGLDRTQIVGMGVTIPGVVDPSTATVLLSVLLPWRNVSLNQGLARRFSFPVAVFSRGSAATWGERWYGAGQNVRNMLYIRAGNGIVAGLVINGQPYLGQGFGAGELGHVTVQPDGILCRCGNQGCLATVATSEALLNRVRQLLRENPGNALWRELDNQLDHITLADLIRVALAGNRLVQQAFAEVARWLAIALASAINLLNLDVIIVGGPMMAAGEILLKPLRAELSHHALPTHLARVEIVASTLKENAPSIGAASLILHELMSPSPLPMKLVSFENRATLFSTTAI